jgi:serine protease Do
MKRLALLMAAVAGVTSGMAAVGPEQPTATARARASSAAVRARVAQAARQANPARAAMAWYGEESPSGSYLGVDIKEITAERVAPLKLKEERGVEVLMVDQDAPAGKAGLKEHDVILEFNGQRIEGHEQLSRMLRETPPGRTVTLGVSRDGQPIQLKATLASRKDYIAKVYKEKMKMPQVRVAPPVMPQIDMPAIDVVVRSYSRATGMMVDNLTPQLGEFFGVKSGEGVLVRSVEKGSIAEAAGIRAGDVIVKVDDDRIADRNDFNRTLRRKEGKASVVIVRDKKEQTLSINVPPRRRPGSEDESFMRYPDAYEDGDFDFDFDADFDWDPGEWGKRINNAFEFSTPQAIAASRLALENAKHAMEFAVPTDWNMDFDFSMDSDCPEKIHRL